MNDAAELLKWALEQLAFSVDHDTGRTLEEAYAEDMGEPGDDERFRRAVQISGYRPT